MHHLRILAIDLRSQQFGFAVIEEPWQLLDSGRKNCRIMTTKDAATIVRKRIVSLLAIFSPSVVVVKHVSGLRGAARKRNTQIMESLRHEAEERGLELVVMKRRDIRRAFRSLGRKNKEEIADLITGFFPELAWKLPPSRKNWEPEHHNMMIFDAVSAGLTYLVRLEDDLSNGFHNPQTPNPG